MSKWTAIWGYRALDFDKKPAVVENETQRVIIRNNLFGEKVRLFFSNAYGKDPMPFERVFLSHADGAGNLLDGCAVTFGGAATLRLKPGEARYSDPIPFPIRPGETLAVSTFIRERTRVSCGTAFYAQPITQVRNSCGGDLCRARAFPPYPQKERMEWVQYDPPAIFLYGLMQVEARADVPTIAAFGDSITHQSRWTGALAQRLYDAFPGKIAVINRGISGNRVLRGASKGMGLGELFGPAGKERFEEDVFGSVPVQLVLALEGVNDIMHPYSGDTDPSEKVSAQALCQGLEEIAHIAHKHKAAIAGGTIMPFKDVVHCWNEEQEQTRVRVNQWIRTAQCFDMLLDFDLFLRDPKEPARLLPEYDGGDNLHPSAAGGEKIAREIDIQALYRLIPQAPI